MTDTELHYTPQSLADLWEVSVSYIRTRFRHEPGVVKLGTRLRIPKSVAERVYRLATVQPSSKIPTYHARRTPTGSVVLEPRARSASR